MEESVYSSEYRVFLDVLRQERLRARLTQIELADRLGETQTFVSKAERGERRLDLVEVRAFCRAIGIPLQKFVMAFDKALRQQRAPARSGDVRQKTEVKSSGKKRG